MESYITVSFFGSLGDYEKSKNFMVDFHPTEKENIKSWVKENCKNHIHGSVVVKATDTYTGEKQIYLFENAKI